MTRKKLAFVVPGPIDRVAGGYAYDRRLIAELQSLGWAVDAVLLEGTYPFPSPNDLAAAEKALGQLDGPVLVDALAFSTMPEQLARHAGLLRLAVLVHHPLALEGALSEAQQDQLATTERRALAFAKLVVTTSDATADILAADYGLARKAIVVAEPGLDVPAQIVRDHEGPAKLVSVAALVPRKGHDVLIEALAGLRDKNWTCRIIGDPNRDPGWTAHLQALVHRYGLAEKVTIAGIVPDVTAELRAADIFVLASAYEGFGMAFSEAMAFSLPVVGCAAGAVPDVVPPQAGILVPPGDARALGAAIDTLIADPARRRDMGAAAHATASRMAGWHDIAARISDALRRLDP